MAPMHVNHVPQPTGGPATGVPLESLAAMGGGSGGAIPVSPMQGQPPPQQGGLMQQPGGAEAAAVVQQVLSDPALLQAFGMFLQQLQQGGAAAGQGAPMGAPPGPPGAF